MRGYSGRVICTGKQGKPGQVTFFCVIAALSRAPGAHRITPSHSFSISKRGWGEVLGLRQTKSTRSLGVSQRNAKSKPTQRGEGPSVFLVYSPQGWVRSWGPGEPAFLGRRVTGWLPRVISGEAVRKLGLIWRSLGHLCWASSFGWLIFQLTWKFLGFSTECSTSQETPPNWGSLCSWSPYLLLPSRSPFFLRPETRPPPKALRVPQN